MLTKYVSSLRDSFEDYSDGYKNVINDFIVEIEKPSSRAFAAYYLIYLSGQMCSKKELIGMLKSGFIEKLIPSASPNIFNIPQDKRFGKNLGEHLVNTHISLHEFEWPKDIGHIDAQVLGLSTLFHDIGKIINVDQHSSIGADIMCKFSLQYNLLLANGIESCTDIYNIINHHMRPLGYQRGENWSDKAVENFIVDCGGHKNAITTVLVAMADKFASTKNVDNLERLYELCERILNSRQENFRKLSENLTGIDVSIVDV